MEIYLASSILLLAILVLLFSSRTSYSPLRLLSSAEANFLKQLVPLLPSDVFIFAKVRIADIVKVNLKPKSPKWYREFRRISQKHADFVICSEKFEILLIIELDDSSHMARSRAKRDAFLDTVLASAKIPILHVPATKSYDKPRLKSEVMSKLFNN